MSLGPPAIRSKARLREKLAAPPASSRLQAAMKAWGCPPLIPLDQKFQSPQQVNYLDLLPKREGAHGAGLHAVAAHQGAALLYLVEHAEDDSPSEGSIQKIRHTLANRSDSAWLGLVSPGTLTLYPVTFGEDLPEAVKITAKQSDAPMFFQSLVQGTFSAEAKPQASDHVYQEIKDLLTRTTDEFAGSAEVKPLDILSMTGRALFFRFLIDRDIVKPEELRDICPSANPQKHTLRDVFCDATRAAETSAWLDDTFNGDFLPLVDDKLKGEARLSAYRHFYQGIGKATDKEIFKHLEAILKGWEAAASEQLTFDWHRLDFAHIPVGVLSEVYEHFSHQVDSQLSRDTSVHYTPRFIAHFMVEEAFAALPGDKSRARVLDPAAGAGIFGVLSFRKLFQERFASTGTRPDKDEIQAILYDQLRAFDVSEPALRLAALALYITAIELNATPRPPKSLKFPRNLRGTVLHHFGESTAKAMYPDDPQEAAFQAMLGSLGDLPQKAASENFDAAFDLVIGNPPWTRLRDEAPEERKKKTGSTGRVTNSVARRANKAFTRLADEILEARGLNELAKDYENPDNAPDVPFLWRAARWAKSSGIIAYALHARLYLHTQPKKSTCWKAVQHGLSIAGIVNGSDLRWTKVWNGMKSPFCLFFARNEKNSGDGFFFASPPAEYAINANSRFRIDYAAVRAVTPQETQQRPWLLKTLSLGNTLDVDVMDRITKACPHTLEKFWAGFDPAMERTGQGYNVSPGLPQTPAPFLGKLLDFERAANKGFSVEWTTFKTYQEKHNCSSGSFPRSPHLYQSPLVIVPKAPGDDIHAPKAWLAERKVAFSQSYYGYACKDSPAPEHVAALIHVLAHSTLARYFILMRSASLGNDFMMFLKDDFDALPFPDVEKLPASKKKRLLDLSSRLQQGEGQMPPEEKEKKAKRGASKSKQEDEPDLFKQASHPVITPSASDTQRTAALAFWHELNDFIYDLYDLGADDVQVIKDTLFSCAAYRRAGEVAFRPTELAPEETGPSPRHIFCQELQDRLLPFFEVAGERVHVGEPAGLRQQTWDTTWRFIAIWTHTEPTIIPAKALREAMDVANEKGLSRIIVHLPQGRGLLVGILDARRWWTRTRARLCAHTITMEHLSAFEVPESSARRAPPASFQRKRVSRR